MISDYFWRNRYFRCGPAQCDFGFRQRTADLRRAKRQRQGRKLAFGPAILVTGRNTPNHCACLTRRSDNTPRTANTLTSFFFVAAMRRKLSGICIKRPIEKINAFAVHKSIFGSGCTQSFSDFGQSARAIKWFCDLSFASKPSDAKTIESTNPTRRFGDITLCIRIHSSQSSTSDSSFFAAQCMSSFTVLFVYCSILISTLINKSTTITHHSILSTVIVSSGVPQNSPDGAGDNDL